MKAKNFRVYEATGHKFLRQAIGYWEGVKDNISFSYYGTLKESREQAKLILSTQNETCIAIEDITAKVLYIVYQDKTEILSEYHHIEAKFKTLYKRFKVTHKNYTLENTGKGIIAFVYTHKKKEVKKQEVKAPLLPEYFSFGQLLF